jgi:hypothetical protein
LRVEASVPPASYGLRALRVPADAQDEAAAARLDAVYAAMFDGYRRYLTRT